MREATKEEREGIEAYIKSISIPTGINFWILCNLDFLKREKYMLDKIAENTGVSTEVLIKVINAINSKCPHDFGVSKDYEIMKDNTMCKCECEVCWKPEEE